MANKDLRQVYIDKIQYINSKLQYKASIIQYALTDEDKALIDLIEESVKDL